MAAWVGVIIGWVAIFVLVAGIGQGARRLIGLADYTWLGWLDSFWIGYAVVIVVLQLVHLVVPIDWRVTVAMGVLGMVAVIACLVRRPKGEAKVHIGHWLVYAVLLTPIMIWLANRALSPQLDFDSGFYHLSSIRWLNEYPIVPGLANLHYRLGFNQTIFLLDAVLNAYPYFDHGFTFVNSLLMMVLMAQLLWGVIDGLLKRDPSMKPYLLYYALLLPICLYRATPQRFSANISSPSPDLSVFIFQIIATVMLVRYLFSAETAQAPKNRFAVLYIVLMCVVGITSKLSFAAFGGVIMLIAVGRWLWQNRVVWRAATAWVVRWVAIIGIVLGAVWVVRTSILTGYPLFPNRAAALPVDYRVPTAITREAELWVYAFARDPRGDMDKTLSNWDWIGGWWWRMGDSFNQYLFVIPLYVSIGAFCAWIVGTILTFVRKKRVGWQRLLSVLPSMVGGVAWFLSAPDPRFAGAVFWLLATGLIVGVILYLPRWFAPRLVSVISVAITGYVLAVTVIADFKFITIFPTIPQPPLMEFHTDSGLVYNKSASVQNLLNLYNAPLPNSPYDHPTLELRGSDLRQGFRFPE